ncbi:hypothetical protein BDC45DRAFT_163976 [Circinella umbellata]|nr:hypothetical protein BDC45DRAFT_163976 [Circinella umbellata]
MREVSFFFRITYTHNEHNQQNYIKPVYYYYYFLLCTNDMYVFFFIILLFSYLGI